MAANIEFHANIKATDNQTQIQHGAGSGLGFYGSTFSSAIAIGSVNQTTFVTNATGTNQGTQLHNTAYANASADSPGSSTDASESFVKVDAAVSNINLRDLPNYKCPLNIRLLSDDGTAVQVRNCKLTIYDKTNIANHASGVTTYVCEARHPHTVEGSAGQYALAHVSSRSDPSHFTWHMFQNGGGNGIEMPLTDSPGISGFNTNGGDITHLSGLSASEQSSFSQGSTHTSTRHDWFIAISSSPDTIGSKQDYALYFEAEYL
ncbi:MAG: hypothetical protein CBC91_03260 [Rickettsiales bacterium TMED131]|nr:MAG: hypothetical protein CBC91_03260 [Rickettsiales bacterium TMED131]